MQDTLVPNGNAQLGYAELQRRYGSRFVARRDETVIASADTYDELSDELERLDESVADWNEVVIEYVEPADSVGVY